MPRHLGIGPSLDLELGGSVLFKKARSDFESDIKLQWALFYFACEMSPSGIKSQDMPSSFYLDFSQLMDYE